MDPTDRRAARRMHDQYSLEEAQLRRAQQLAAGESHRPVQDLPPHGERPPVHQDTALLRRQYEAAQVREAKAWARVRALPGEAGFAEAAWEDWRDAVEARDRATRLLINQAMELGSRPADPGQAPAPAGQASGRSSSCASSPEPPGGSR